MRTAIAYAVSSAVGGFIWTLMVAASALADQARAPVEGLSIADLILTNMAFGIVFCATAGFAITAPVYWALRRRVPIKSDILSHGIFGAIVPCAIVFVIFLILEEFFPVAFGDYANGMPAAERIAVAAGNATAAGLIGASCGLAFGWTSALLQSRANRKR